MSDDFFSCLNLSKWDCKVKSFCGWCRDNSGNEYCKKIDVCNSKNISEYSNCEYIATDSICLFNEVILTILLTLIYTLTIIIITQIIKNLLRKHLNNTMSNEFVNDDKHGIFSFDTKINEETSLINEHDNNFEKKINYVGNLIGIIIYVTLGIATIILYYENFYYFILEIFFIIIFIIILSCLSIR